MTGSKVQRCAVALSVAVLVFSVASCSGGSTESGAGTENKDVVGGTVRSPQAYCQTFYTEGEKFRQRYQGGDLASDPTKALIVLLGAPQEAALFFGKLGKVAPEEIEPDVSVLQKAMQKVSDDAASNAGDPVKGMVAALVAGAATKGSEDRVNAFTLKNCGPPPSAASSPDSTSTSTPPNTTATNATVAPGETVLSVATDGYAVTAMNSDAIAMMASVEGRVGVRTYDLNGNKLAENLDAASFEPNCKLAIVRRFDGVNVVLTIMLTKTAAKGVEPAHETQTLIASDAATLQTLWTSKLGQDGAVSYCSPGATSGNDLQSNVSFTEDGRWGLITLSWNVASPRILDLSTCLLRGAPSMVAGRQEVSVAGSYILVNDSDSAIDDRKISVIDPSSGKTLGTTRTLSVLMSHDFYPLENNILLATSDITVNEGTGITQVLSLPSLKPIWSKQTRALGAIRAFMEAETGTLILSGSSLVGMSPRSGVKLWELKDENVQVCAAAGGKLMVSVNGQIAYLDPRTGKQLSYDAQQSSCPTMLSDRYADAGDGTTQKIIRVL